MASRAGPLPDDLSRNLPFLASSCKYKGVAVWESFQLGDRSKRGPERGIQRGEKKREPEEVKRRTEMEGLRKVGTTEVGDGGEKRERRGGRRRRVAAEWIWGEKLADFLRNGLSRLLKLAIVGHG